MLEKTLTVDAVTTLPATPTINPLQEADDIAVRAVTEKIEQLVLNPIRPSTYLYLDETEDNAIYLISMAPMNSSGDIYHILSYLILAEAFHKQVPQILLTYDGKEVFHPDDKYINTYSQAQRCLAFVQMLGYGQYFLPPVMLKTGKCTRESNRQYVLEGYLTDLQQNINYIDQRALTAMLSYAILEHGKDQITDKLKVGFARRNTQLPYIHHQNVKTRADEWVNYIRSQSGERELKLIVIMEQESFQNVNSNALY